MKFKRIKKLHFVGIGGVGMCGIAEILRNSGYEITGSDLKQSETTIFLEKLGIRISYSHNSENIEGSDVVVTSSAVTDDNPEVMIFLEISSYGFREGPSFWGAAEPVVMESPTIRTKRSGEPIRFTVGWFIIEWCSFTPGGHASRIAAPGRGGIHRRFRGAGSPDPGVQWCREIC